MTGFNKNILVLLNRDLIRYNQNWKDSLEHELTHLIQRIVGLNNSLKSSYKYLGPNNMIKFNDNIKNLIQEILNKTSLNKNEVDANLVRFINYLIKVTEQHPMIKPCINAVQRLYEQSQLTIINNKFKYNFKNLENKNTWLNKFLSQLQIDNNFINLFDTYFIKDKSNLTIIELKNYNKMMCILTCLIFKCLNYNIEEKLQNHFKKFKLRDF